MKSLAADKKFRSKYGLYVIEGERLVREAFRFGKKVESVYVCEGSDLPDFGVPAEILSEKVYRAVSDTVHGQGILATVKIEEQSLSAPQGNCLVLDNVSDPGNMGALLRSACATGFDSVYAIGGADLYSPKVIRAAMSAHFALKLYSATAQEVFSLLKGACEIVCADLSGEDAFTFSPKGNVALVLGNEGNGLSDFARQNCDGKLTLTMKNNLESLNVAVAGSVLMYLIGNKTEEH